MGKHKKSVHEPRIDARSPVQTHGFHTPVRCIIHETISHNVPGTADMTGVGDFWRRQGLGYGAHLGLDEEAKTCRYAPDRSITWHTGGRNTGSLGIEIVSMKWMSRLAWWKKAPRELHKLAKWMAWYNKEYSIPLVWNVEKGFSTHFMQSKAFPSLTDHTDGENLPKRRVMRLAKKYRREGW